MKNHLLFVLMQQTEPVTSSATSAIPSDADGADQRQPATAGSLSATTSATVLMLYQFSIGFRHSREGGNPGSR